MLNTKAVNEVMVYVEREVKAGYTIEEALKKLSKREEARAGYIYDVLEFLQNDAARYTELKIFLRQEEEIAAQEKLIQ